MEEFSRSLYNMTNDMVDMVGEPTSIRYATNGKPYHTFVVCFNGGEERGEPYDEWRKAMLEYCAVVKSVSGSLKPKLIIYWRCLPTIERSDGDFDSDRRYVRARLLIERQDKPVEMSIILGTGQSRN